LYTYIKSLITKLDYLINLLLSVCPNLDKEPPVDRYAARVSTIGVARVCLDAPMVKAGVVGHGHAFGAVVFTILKVSYFFKHF